MILHKTVKNVMLSIALLVFMPGVIRVIVVAPFFETREKGFAWQIVATMAKKIKPFRLIHTLEQ
jgi:hypothetical protein